VDPTPASRAFTVDTARPDTTIDSGPSGATADATPTFDLSADEPGSTLECRIDGGAWLACASPATTGPLADGAHTFEVRATDPAGNVDSTPASRSFTVDTAAPNTTIDSGPTGATSDSTPAFTFSANQAGSTFECRVDGGVWSSCSSPETTASLADGAHTFEVRATDPAGNVDPTPASRSFTVDTVAPQTTIDAAPGALTSDPTPTFEFSADQPGATYECRVDGGAWAACAGPHTTPALPDGSHTFEVRARDAAGNVDATPAQVSFDVQTPPNTTIASGPSGITTDSTPTFAFSSDEPGVTFECRVDGGAWTACPASFTSGPLAVGPHTLEVRATDPSGNVDPTPAARLFAVAAPPAPSPGVIEPSERTPAPAPTTPPPSSSDLGALPGSLVADRSCQRLGAGLRTKRTKVKGIGRVSIKIKASAIVMSDTPLAVSVTGPRAGKGRLRSVRYTLDGRGLRAGRRQPFAAAITPSALARVGRHALALKLKPKRGPARTVKLGMRTFPCKTVFRAYQKRAGKGAQLKLRLDARDAVGKATFSVPRKLLPKGKAGLKVGSLKVVSASSASRSWNLGFGAQPTSGVLLGGFGAPQVTVTGSTVSVAGLPAGTGIVELYLTAPQRSARVKRGRSVTLRGTVSGSSSQRLTYKLRGR
jgi:hypothetical protein